MRRAVGFVSFVSTLTAFSLVACSCLLLLFRCGVVAAISSASSSSSSDDNKDHNNEDHSTWNQCHLFIAPSSMGWGVFAGRAFRKGEMVEFSPLILAFDRNAPLVQNTVIDDYIYGYFRIDPRTNTVGTLSTVLLGNGMYFNHHVEPNVKYMMLSKEPDAHFPQGSNVVGYIARRDIEAGEELYSTYGEDDGGERWFRDRKIDLMIQPTNVSRISADELPSKMNDYCTGIYAGIGLERYATGVKPILPRPEEINFEIDLSERLYELDSGVGNARAKMDISVGTRIEIGPGMLLDSRAVAGTVIAPLTFPWQILSKSQQDAIRELQKEENNIMVQYQGADTGYERIERFESFELTTVFPSGGSIGMVRRLINREDSNCELIIHPKSQEGAVGLTLELVAMKDIQLGEVLKMHMAPTTREVGDWTTFLREMKLTGQNYYWKELEAIASVGENSKDTSEL